MTQASFDAALRAALCASRRGQLDGASPALLSAVSGGPDSTALAILCESHARRDGLRHRAIVVNHGLRADAGDEAERVVRRLRAIGIDAARIDVTAPAPDGGVQEWAREARYRILFAQARSMGAALVLGHHPGDQAETVAMRLVRDSGLAGLGAMRGVSARDGVAVVRPFLDMRGVQVDKALLCEVCEGAGVAFESDPSNLDTRFERVRVRRRIARIERGGFDATRQLCRLAEAAAAIDGHLLRALAQERLLPRPSPTGHALVPARALDLPTTIRARLFCEVTGLVGGAAHPPSRAAIDVIAARLAAGRGGTLSRCKFTATAGGWLVTAEPGRRQAREVGGIEPGRDIVFAGRWKFTSSVPGKVRHLGEAGSGARAAWRDVASWRGLDAEVRRSLPVLETLDGNVVYPHLMHQGQSHGGGTTSPATAEFIAYAQSAGPWRQRPGQGRGPSMPELSQSEPEQSSGGPARPGRNRCRTNTHQHMTREKS